MLTSHLFWTKLAPFLSATPTTTMSDEETSLGRRAVVKTKAIASFGEIFLNFFFRSRCVGN